MRTASVAVFFAFATLAASIRRKRWSCRGCGLVAGLYTYGAPKPSPKKLSNPAHPKGCWPGYRIVNIKEGIISTDIDPVPAIPPASVHPEMSLLNMGNLGSHYLHECGKKKWTSWKAWFPVYLHKKEEYIKRAQKVDRIREVTNIGLKNSYEQNITKMKQNLANSGWAAVGTVIVGGDDVSHLIQKRSTKQCLLTFEGSDSDADWEANLRTRPERFCGLDREVHRGFKEKLLLMASSADWQSKIRSKLTYCSKVEVVGHSLGGALAALFTACSQHRVNKGAVGYDENVLLRWYKLGRPPVNLPEI